MWPHGLCSLIGVWLMAAPQTLGFPEPARSHHHIVGPILATIACTAMFQSVRGVRWVNVPIGAWLILAPLLLGYRDTPWIHDVAAGAAVVLLSSIRGEIRHRFGGGWSALLHSWSRPPIHRETRRRSP